MFQVILLKISTNFSLFWVCCTSHPSNSTWFSHSVTLKTPTHYSGSCLCSLSCASLNVDVFTSSCPSSAINRSPELEGFASIDETVSTQRAQSAQAFTTRTQAVWTHLTSEKYRAQLVSILMLFHLLNPKSKCFSEHHQSVRDFTAVKVFLEVFSVVKLCIIEHG